MLNLEIECPNCHYRRTIPSHGIPLITTMITCPRCGEKFTHHFITRDQQVSAEAKGQKSTSNHIPTDKVIITIQLRQIILAAVVLFAIITVVTAMLYAFVGRIHFYDFPVMETTVLKDWEYTDSTHTQKMGTPVPNLPVFVSVSVRSQYRLYWGDGSNYGRHVEKTLFYTYTDATGKVRLPVKKHWTYIKGGMSQKYVEDIALYIVYDDEDLGLQTRVEEPPNYLPDRIFYPRYEGPPIYINPRSELMSMLNDTSAKPLLPEDGKRRVAFDALNVPGGKPVRWSDPQDSKDKKKSWRGRFSEWIWGKEMNLPK